MKRVAILTPLLFFILIISHASAIIEFKDGLTHNVDYEIAYDDVWVDFQSPGMHTVVNLLPNGRIYNQWNAYNNSSVNIMGGTGGLTAYDSTTVTVSSGFYSLYANGSTQANVIGGSGGEFCARDISHVSISGGSIQGFLKAGDNSQVTISNGQIEKYLEAAGNTQVSILGGIIGGANENCLISHDNSRVNISGGIIKRNLCLEDDSSMIISGGQIAGENDIIVGTFSSGVNAALTLIGSNFAIDGHAINYGELTSILKGDWRDEPWRHLTGTLANGDLIDNDFKIGYEAKIILIPEPASLLLLGFGGLLIRKQ